ncbi:hypothetical protein [Siphonobacter aquaeclarae]|uniref:AAA domain-containing protein n=1 Tax=Siphonobacter aquaeclarae TaxID=563176 RepID=A0A1G9SV01_9BACT|nr:hypothetical protein [Siphonobacter aquaeclarae]SDM39231.1 hypothetical protein SAMN04488090_3306 [Siphonobacter aquaeclarae]
MIRKITIENVKGISKKELSLDIIPNKPSILVAPNGFGKSSFATAFRRMNGKRINLSKNDFFKEDETLSPRVELLIRDSNGHELSLEATKNSNSIFENIDVFVIHSMIRPKGIRTPFGPAAATLTIDDITVLRGIPKRVEYNYRISEFKKKFGKNGKALDNLSDLLKENSALIEKIGELASEFKKQQKETEKKIDNCIKRINEFSGKISEVKEFVNENIIQDFKSIKCIERTKDVLENYGLIYSTEAEYYLSAVQIFWIYCEDSTLFKKVSLYHQYESEKKRLKQLLDDFNSSWLELELEETERTLVVRFPDVVHMSNGQRDILSLIALLLKARIQLKKKIAVLILDEVFDYLDDANLIASQYFISKFIDQYKLDGGEIYPLILTHLDPYIFQNYVFSSQKIYYLDDRPSDYSHAMLELVKKRNEIQIKEDVSKYLFHFHPTRINKRSEFKELKLKETWGEGDIFYTFIFEELRKYILGEKYCPLSICCAIRVKIEKIVFESLPSNSAKNDFLETKSTREKLDLARERYGISVSETYYILGMIYNEPMHIRQGDSRIPALVSKLENKAIRTIIKEAFA